MVSRSQDWRAWSRRGSRVSVCGFPTAPSPNPLQRMGMCLPANASCQTELGFLLELRVWNLAWLYEQPWEVEGEGKEVGTGEYLLLGVRVMGEGWGERGGHQRTRGWAYGSCGYRTGHQGAGASSSQFLRSPALCDYPCSHLPNWVRNKGGE